MVNNQSNKEDLNGSGVVEIEELEEIGQIKEKSPAETSRSAGRRRESGSIINVNYRSMNRDANEIDS